MTKKNIEIKVDVMRQFELLRRTTFKDPLCFLDEDIQNADRSGAKNVYITCLNGTITIENDGEVLLDPEVLFTMGKSGWSQEVKESENPFGMGFFSNVPASNYIEVFSGNHRVVFDERDGLNIYSEDSEVFYDGFKLVLHNFHIQEVHNWDISNRVELLGKHIHNMDIYYNSSLIEKKSLTQGEGRPFEISIENDGMLTGWLSLTEGSFGDKVKVFYKGRYVASMDDFYYIKGELHVNDKALTLQSPDRKAIIKDEKYTTFKKSIKNYIQKLAENAVLSGTEENVKKYESSIDLYLDNESVRYKIPFLVFDGKAENEMDYLKDIALAINKDKEIKTIGEYEIFLRKQKEDEKDKEMNFTYSFEEKANEMVEVYEQSEEEQGQETYYVPSIHTTKKSKQNTKSENLSVNETGVKGKQIYLSADTKETVFWVKLEEIPEYEKRIELIKAYGIRLIISQNKIQQNILVNACEKNVHHVRYLEQKVTIKSYISNAKLSAKERRANMLLDMISRMYGFEDNVFQIGDVMITKYVEVPSLGIQLEKIEEDINVVANKEEAKIFIDRSLIMNSMLSDHEEVEIEINDYKFILLHLKDLIAEISLLDSKGNREELYEKTVLALAIA